MNVSRRPTLIVAGLMTLQSVLGLAAPEQYRDVEWIKATWFGNDWVTLVVAVPVLLAGLAGARHGSVRGFLVWAGVIGYAIYNYAFYLLGTSLNAFFPLYVVAVVFASIVLIRALGALDIESLASHLRPAAPVRVLGGCFVLIGAGLALVWTATWAAYVFAGQPTPVNPDVFRLVAALDLSLMVPALVFGGALLWRRRPWGPVVAAIGGVQGSLYLLVLSVNSIVSIQRGLTVWPGELPIWVPLGGLTGLATVWLLSSVGDRSLADAHGPR